MRRGNGESGAFDEKDLSLMNATASGVSETMVPKPFLSIW